MFQNYKLYYILLCSMYFESTVKFIFKIEFVSIGGTGAPTFTIII